MGRPASSGVTASVLRRLRRLCRQSGPFSSVATFEDPSMGIAAWIAGLKKEELGAVHHLQMLERLVEVRTAEPVELEGMAGGSVRTSLYVDRPERLRAAIGELRAALRWLEGASL